MINSSLRSTLFATALVAILGCSVKSILAHSSEPDLNDFAPESNPGPKAVLDYAGPKIEVDVKHSLANGEESIDLAADGQILEHEGYVRTQDSFSLANAAGDKFEPPLPLLSEKGVKSWSGSLVSGGVTHSAKATIAVTPSTVKSHPVDQDALLSTVSLMILDQGDTHAVRTLKFWVVKGRGVVQRDFSEGVKRLPAGG